MLYLENFVKKLNQNKIFKFLSSVKLAVPLMLFLGAIVAWGTVLESRYNAEYAGMILYKSEWFSVILVLLWINIFCATISRIPFKKHHIGFVITHIGLLTLLIGGFLTNSFGIDGQLSVTEGQSSSTVVLPNLMVGFQLDTSPTPQMVKFKKMIYAKNKNQLSFINDELGSLFQVEEYIPFAKVEKVYKVADAGSEEVALSFILKSNFFNVNEWLHTKNNPTMQLGPATLKIVKVNNLDLVEAPAKKAVLKNKTRMVNSVQPVIVRKINSEASEKLIIVDFKTGKTVKSISLDDLSKKALQLSNVKISLVKRYRSAVVAANKLEENLDPNSQNPALELKIEKNSESLREILYGKFEQFSLNKDGAYGYRFIYKTDLVTPVENSAAMGAHQTQGTTEVKAETSDVANPHSQVGGAANSSTAVSESAGEAVQPIQAPAIDSMGSRIIEFKVNPKDPKRVRVSLYKNNEFVQSEILTEGQSYQTPWMGMKIFVGTLQVGAEEASEVVEISPEKRSQLPPSALKIKTSDGSNFWLTEGEQKSVTNLGKKYTVYFGREFLDLPFDINLQKFTKYDYPGTSTAMSYESVVQIGKTGITKLISMNEPYKQSDFTIYQASYILTPGQTPVSIFSVNKDPGRFLKYLGSLILALGIITFTLMRSTFYRNLNKGAK